MDLLEQPHADCYSSTYHIMCWVPPILNSLTLLITIVKMTDCLINFVQSATKWGNCSALIMWKWTASCKFPETMNSAQLQSLKCNWKAPPSALFPCLMRVNICDALWHCFSVLYCIRNQKDKWPQPVQGIRTSCQFNHN